MWLHHRDWKRFPTHIKDDDGEGAHHGQGHNCIDEASHSVDAQPLSAIHLLICIRRLLWCIWHCSVQPSCECRVLCNGQQVSSAAPYPCIHTLHACVCLQVLTRRHVRVDLRAQCIC
jgi:hypothetical protein